MEDIREALAEKPEITLAGTTLRVSAQKIYTEPMELYQMAGTKGYVLVVPDAVAERLSGDKIRLVMSLADGGYPELKQELKRFLNNGRDWRPLLQDGKELPERVAVGVTVKAWGVENSLTGFTAISFGGLYLSVIFILLASTMLAFEQLSGLEHSRRSYGILEKLGVDMGMRRKLARSEVRTFFFVPAVLPVATTVCLIAGAQRMFGEAFLRENLVWTAEALRWQFLAWYICCTTWRRISCSAVTCLLKDVGSGGRKKRQPDKYKGTRQFCGLWYNFLNKMKQRRKVMIQQRSIAVCIILTIVTCGIYGVYWFICLTNDANTASNTFGTSGGMAVLLTIVTCGIYGLYWAYKQGEKIDAAKANRGVPSSNSGILYLILSIFSLGIVAWALMQNELNKMA